MALGFTDRSRSIIRNKRMLTTSIAFDSSYPTGGEAFTAADLGLGTIDFISFSTDGNNSVVWDRANSKLKVFTAAGAEVANATNLSTLVVDALVIGS